VSLDDLAIYLSNLSAIKGISVYEIARKHGWPEGSVQALMRCERKPSSKMLKDLAAELDSSPKYLSDALKR
jgi:hypothetical protein